MSLIKPLFAITVLLLASTVSALTVRSDDSVTINEAHFNVFAREQSQVRIEELAKIHHAVVGRDAMMTINGGEISKLYGRGSSVISATNSRIREIAVGGSSELTLDSVANLQRLFLIGHAKLNIIATDVSYNGKLLTGTWADGNAFSFQMVNAKGFLKGELPRTVAVTAPNNVPLSPAAGFFTAALVSLGLLGRRRNLGAAFHS